MLYLITGTPQVNDQWERSVEVHSTSMKLHIQILVSQMSASFYHVICLIAHVNFINLVHYESLHHTDKIIYLSGSIFFSFLTLPFFQIISYKANS